ncbi:hypothetical protein BKA69DRAFT_1101687 [Paraphysoderma sedebokerense]|nr:hypothetical protein BKA69DRAFT_1102860 [Paraphysoderma sedebokerense]KAI9136871.1 hypothetical protein BKA69DRAFT_1101687 [Paraphysoderma sedebokerense]
MNRLMGLLASWGGRAYKVPDAAALKRHQSDMLFALLRGFNTILTFIYLIVASKSLSFFDCTKEADGYSYLDSDPGLRCYEEEWWNENQVMAWSGVV